MLHGVIKTSKKVPQPLQNGVDQVIIRMRGTCVFQELLQEQDVLRYSLDWRQEESAQIQAIASRLIQAVLNIYFLLLIYIKLNKLASVPFFVYYLLLLCQRKLGSFNWSFVN